MKVDSFIHLNLQEFKQRKIYRTFIIIEIFIASIILAIIMALLEPYLIQICSVSSQKFDNLIRFEASDSLSEDASSRLTEFMSDKNNITRYGTGYHLSVEYSPGKIAQSVFYDETSADMLELQLYKGIQLSDYSGGYIPAVMNYKYHSEYKLNDVINISILTGDNAGESLKLIVIGFLDKNNMYFNFNAGGSNTLQNIYSHAQADMIIRYTIKPNELIRSNQTYYAEAAEGQSDNILSYLGRFGNVNSIKQMKAAVWRSFLNSGYLGMLILLFMTVIVVITVIGMCSSSREQDADRRKIYSICGMKSSYIYASLLFRNLLLFAAPAFTGFYIIYIMADSGNNPLTMTYISFAALALYIILLYALSALRFDIKAVRYNSKGA